jgi:hypothetical protein
LGDVTYYKIRHCDPAGKRKSMANREIGVLTYLRRYPVKSMKGEDLRTVSVTKYGISGDRTYAFIDENAQDKKFPWMTARQAHEMLLFEPSFADASLSRVIVKTPEGARFDVEDSVFEEFLERRFNRGLVLRHDTSGGCQDSKPVSLFGMSTVRALSEEVGIQLSRERFRANLYVQWNGEIDKPFFEDSLVGRTLVIGSEVRLRVVKKDSRCVIPTLDPQTGIPLPEVLKNISQNHGGCAGVYAVVESEGVLKLSDPIQIVDAQNKS